MPSYIKEFPLINQPPEQFLAMARRACIELGWKVGFVSDSGLIAETEMPIDQNNSGEEITITLEPELATIQSVSKGNAALDSGRNKTNISDLLRKVKELDARFSPDDYEIEIEKLKQVKVSPENDILRSQFPKEKTKWWAFFIPSKTHFVLPILMDLNIILFVLMCVSSGSVETILQPNNDVLLHWGANFKPLTLAGEWWRLFTCMFEHIGIIHLLMNMYALLYVGLFLEPILGKWRFLIAYISSGLFASLASLWWHDNTISAGASGAIFGMYGVFLALLLTNLLEKSVRNAILKSIGIFIAYNLLFGLKAGVDNSAHIGGLLSGFIIGFLLYFDITKIASKVTKVAMLILILLLPIIASFVLFPKIKNPFGDYQKVFERFQEFETVALSAYKQDTPIDSQVYLADLKNDGIPNWEKAINELKKLDAIDLPKELIPIKQSLQQYAQLRYQEAVMHKELLAGEKIHSDSSFTEIENRIEQVLKNLQ